MPHSRPLICPRYDPHTASYKLVHHYMLSSRCIVGEQLLRVLLDALCGQSCTMETPAGLVIVPDAIVRDINVLELLVDWRVWSRAHVSTWQRLAACLCSLVDPDTNHFSRVNAGQLRQAGTVQQLLFAWQEERLTYPGLVTLCLVRCVNFVLELSHGNPVTDVSLLLDFAIATHPAAEGECCRSNHNYLHACSPSHMYVNNY